MCIRERNMEGGGIGMPKNYLGRKKNTYNNSNKNPLLILTVDLCPSLWQAFYSKRNVVYSCLFGYKTVVVNKPNNMVLFSFLWCKKMSKSSASDAKDEILQVEIFKIFCVAWVFESFSIH